MGFFELRAVRALVVLIMVSVLWAISVPLKVAGISDMWGPRLAYQVLSPAARIAFPVPRVPNASRS